MRLAPIIRTFSTKGTKTWGRRFPWEGAAERAASRATARNVSVAARENWIVRKAGQARRGAKSGVGVPLGPSSLGPQASGYATSIYDQLSVTAPIVARAAGRATKRFVMEPGAVQSALRQGAKGGLLYGVGDTFSDLAEEMEAAGKGGSWIPGLVGFGFKAAGWRAGLRAAPRSLSRFKSPNLRSMGQTSLKAYDRFAYKMPRQLASGVLGVTGRAANSLVTTAAVGAFRLPFNMARGAGQTMGAFVGGTVDVGSHIFRGRARRITRAGQAAIGGSARAPGGPRGILNRMQSLEFKEESNKFLRTFLGKQAGHPILGPAAIGLGFGAVAGAGRAPGYVPNGINPQNYGSGITYANNRGHRSVSLGHQNVADRMMRGRR